MICRSLGIRPHEAEDVTKVLTSRNTRGIFPRRPIRGLNSANLIYIVRLVLPGHREDKRD